VHSGGGPTAQGATEVRGFAANARAACADGRGWRDTLPSAHGCDLSFDTKTVRRFRPLTIFLVGISASECCYGATAGSTLYWRRATIWIKVEAGGLTYEILLVRICLRDNAEG
jgi:hypothetical protein